MFSCFLVPKALSRSCANLVHGTLTVSESWWDECTNKLLTPTMICFQVKQNELRKSLFPSWTYIILSQSLIIRSDSLTHYICLTMTQGGCEAGQLLTTSMICCSVSPNFSTTASDSLATGLSRFLYDLMRSLMSLRSCGPATITGKYNG